MFCRTRNIKQGMFLSYATWIKKLSTVDTCYFKAAGAIDPEPKRIKYFIFRTPRYIRFLHCSFIWLATISFKSAYLKNVIWCNLKKNTYSGIRKQIISEICRN